jgi:hypothetical protein
MFHEGLMRNFSLKETVELVGIAAIVASLVFVGLQIRQEKEVAIVDTYGEMSQSNIDLTFKIGEQMEIWKKGLDGGELTEEELGVFSVQAASIGEYFQRMFIRWSRLGPVNPSVAASSYAFALYVFPGLRQEYELMARYESSKDSARGFEKNLSPFESAVGGYLEKFDRENPPIPTKKNYVFWGY